MGFGANAGKGAMKKKPEEPRVREQPAAGADAAPTSESKARSKAERDAVARAVLEALNSHDPL